MATSSANIGNVKSMTVDGVEITPTKTYNFTTTGTHNIEVRCVAGYDLTYLLYNINSATEVEIGDATVIGIGAFNSCSSLQKVTIKGTIDSIGSGAFNGCSSLTQIYITETTKCPSIIDTTFYNIHAGSSTTSGGTVYYPENIDFSSWFSTSPCYLGYYDWNTEDVVVDNVKYKISTATNTATTVGFTSGITSSITYKYSIQYNGQTYTINRIFSIIAADVSHLDELNITFEDGITDDMLPTTGQYTHTEGIFKDVRTKVKSITLSKDMTMNGSHLACYNCTNLTTFTYTSQYTTDIGAQFFFGCKSLTNLNRVLEAAKTIGASAFFGCTSLTSINLTSVNTIGDDAFDSCHNLTSIIIGSNINSIKDGSFKYCSKVNRITINKSVAPTISAHTWGGYNNSDTTGCDSGTTNILYVPSDATGYDTTNWTAYLLNPSYGKFTLSKTL